MIFSSFKTAPIWGLFFLCIAAFFSKGFHHPDEHFQILEMAALKLGLTSPGDLPWEFHEKMRSAFQPWLAVGVDRLGCRLGICDPFFITILLRLLSAVLSWLASYSLLKTFLNDLKSNWSKSLAIVVSFFFF